MRPNPDEYAAYYETYVGKVQSSDVLASLKNQMAETLATLRAVPEAGALHRYAEGKWTLKEVVGHIIDAERVFGYRALRFARNDATALPGFDQNPYVENSNANTRPWNDLLSEFEHVRRGTILMFKGLDDAAWLRRGSASGNEVSVRALAYIIAGHEAHHLGIVRAKYL